MKEVTTSTSGLTRTMTFGELSKYRLRICIFACSVHERHLSTTIGFVTSAGQAGTSSGTGGGNGGEGYALATLDSNLTSANFPSTLTGKTHICSGGGGALQLNGANPPSPRGGVGGTNGGNGARSNGGSTPIAGQEMSAATSYGCGGGHGWQGSTASMGLGMGGVVIVRMT